VLGDDHRAREQTLGRILHAAGELPRIHLSKSGNTAQTSEQKREAIDGPHFGISMKASLS